MRCALGVPERVARLAYSILHQSYTELDVEGSSPSVSMWPHLLASEETQLANTISVYSERGTTKACVRLLYMNDVALRVWGRMGHPCVVQGTLHRPPRTAVLAFGKPFSE